MNWKLWTSYFVVGAVILVLISPSIGLESWNLPGIFGAWMAATIMGFPIVWIARSLYRDMKKEMQHKERETKGICRECGAKDVTLHDVKGKLVCWDCWEKITKPYPIPPPERVERRKEIKKAPPPAPKTTKEKISGAIYEAFPKLKRKKEKKK